MPWMERHNHDEQSVDCRCEGLPRQTSPENSSTGPMGARCWPRTRTSERHRALSRTRRHRPSGRQVRGRSHPTRNAPRVRRANGGSGRQRRFSDRTSHSSHESRVLPGAGATGTDTRIELRAESFVLGLQLIDPRLRDGLLTHRGGSRQKGSVTALNAAASNTAGPPITLSLQHYATLMDTSRPNSIIFSAYRN
jgi:hypothetical protein